ncbi:MAG TPA: hypothetical protein VER55_02330 [Ardenticatenaceae bacterium]|nr:hypothetical protein [Ardenticatenaceae bacterium]
MIEARYEAPAELERLQRRALIVGIGGAGLCALGAFLSLEQFFRSYLLGYLFWASIALGSLGITLLDHAVGGAWALAIRRFVEASARTIPLMLVLFLPLALGLNYIYEWTHTEVVQADPLLLHKSRYLNVPFFLARTAFYFVVWIALAFILTRWSRAQDEAGDPRLARRIRTFSSAGLALIVLTVTFAAYDWVMSLEPHWFSSIFGAVIGASAVIAAFAFTIIVVSLFSRRDPLADVASPALFGDLGSLMLAFVMIWAYLSFSQFLIIWSANIPEEATWYLRRLGGGWEWVAIVVVLLHFAVPFVLLLARPLRRDARQMRRVAGLILVMSFIHMFWQVTPAFSENGFRIHWLDLVTPIAVGGLWVAAFIWQLRGWSLLPLHDPRLEEQAEADGHH